MREESAVKSSSAMSRSGQDLVWTVDLNYRLLHFNRNFSRCARKYLHWDPCAGDNLQLRIKPDEAAGLIECYQQALKNGHHQQKHRVAGGSLYNFHFNSLYQGARPFAVSILGKDITQLVHTLQENARLAAIVESSTDAMHVLLPDGTISVWNEASERLFGYSHDEIVGRHVECLIPPQGRQIFRHCIADLSAGKSLNGIDVNFLRKDGSMIAISLSSAPIRTPDGEISGFATSIRDVSERRKAERLLRESEERFRATFEQASVGIIHADFNTSILRANTRFSAMLGYSTEEIVGTRLEEVTLPEDRQFHLAVQKSLLDNPARTICVEKRYVRKDHSTVWARVTLFTQRNSECLPLHLTAFVEEITAQKRAEEQLDATIRALRMSEIRYRTIFETCLDPIVLVRIADERLIEVNDACLDYFGYTREEIVGHTPVDLRLWKTLADYAQWKTTVYEQKRCHNCEIRLRKKDGTFFWGEISATVIEIDGEEMLLAIARDISKSKEAEAEIRSLAFYDPLTGLPNRRFFQDCLEQVLSDSKHDNRNNALLFVDIDNFKVLNDTLGHAIGDQLLAESAQRLSKTVGQSGTVARFGGDEFIVMIEKLNDRPDEAMLEARAIGEKILSSLGGSYLLDGHECRSSASLGISLFNGQTRSVDEALQQADLAMYQAKSSGRNTLRFFAPALQAALQARTTLETELRQAIVAEQFLIYYQPQFSHGKLTGAEALLRWHHPRHGILSPTTFIPLAEESGLILPIGAWVLESACRQVALWAERYPDFSPILAVNISALQLRQPDFADQLLSTLSKTGADPGRIRLELTESMLADDVEDLISKMMRLRKHGIRFSLDDFGTGYSSLSYLKRLPLDQLKIDWSFVRDILSDSSSSAIAQTIIALSRAMGLPVLAEGIENPEQQRFLNRMGCHAFQGFLLGRPLPLHEFEAFLPSHGHAVQPAH